MNKFARKESVHMVSVVEKYRVVIKGYKISFRNGNLGWNTNKFREETTKYSDKTILPANPVKML